MPGGGPQTDRIAAMPFASTVTVLALVEHLILCKRFFDLLPRAKV